ERGAPGRPSLTGPCARKGTGAKPDRDTARSGRGRGRDESDRFGGSGGGGSRFAEFESTIARMIALKKWCVH
ncbi:MAG: hypothetical protein SNJ76_13125, partial [Fimbriimonadaceae bacterium]